VLIGLSFVAGLGIAAASMVTVVMAGTVTLLPAAIGLVRERSETSRWRGVVAAGLVSVGLLGLGAGVSPLLVAMPLAVVVLLIGFLPFSGNRLRRPLPPRREKPLRETFWYRLSRRVQARPWFFAVGGTLVLLVLALPVLQMRMAFADEGNYGEDTTTRQAYDLLATGFGPGANGPLLVATEISGPGDLARLGEVATAIADDPDVAAVSPVVPSPDGRAAILQVQPESAPQDEATEQLVDRLRTEVIPAATAGTGLEPKVSGFVAASIDFASYLSGRMLVFFAAVLGLSFLLLMAVFRSLLVPLKAVVMNMLSIGAAYGVVVAIFQWGWLGSLFGIEPAPIEPFIPMMLFAVVFGLSMDYEVFLLSRIKEEYEKTGDPVNSVADGLAATARVITTAAAIMVVVFGSFVFEPERVVKLFGLGLATAVLVDASLVRMLIVPSTMELLGARNWWLPRWLDRLLPDLNVEGTHHRRDADATGAEESADERVPVGAGRS
jgi:RND superfamily putative drug exporter